MLTKFDNPTFGQMIADRAPLLVPRSPNKTALIRAYRTAEQKAFNDSGDLQGMLRKVGHSASWHLPTEIVPAEIGALDLDDARHELCTRHQALLDRIERHFQSDLEEAAQANRVGRIEWLGERACRFHYFENQRSRTLTTIRTRTVKNTHDLIDARKVRLPASQLRKPRKCQQIIHAMPDWLARHSYIVAGTQIAANIEQVNERAQPNELMVAARWLGRSAKSGAAAIGNAVATPLVALTDIVDDPALVVGDYVLTGWVG